MIVEEAGQVVIIEHTPDGLLEGRGAPPKRAGDPFADLHGSRAENQPNEYEAEDDFEDFLEVHDDPGLTSQTRLNPLLLPCEPDVLADHFLRVRRRPDEDQVAGGPEVVRHILPPDVGEVFEDE